MNEKFNSKKSAGLGALFLIVSFMILFLGFGLQLILNQPLGFYEFLIKTLISILVIGLFIWCWTGTCYIIDKEKLSARCGPFRFPVPIQSIKTIRTDQKTINGIIKPTLSWECIEIEYGKGKILSISPENQDRFIKTLTDSNKEIKIKYPG